MTSFADHVLDQLSAVGTVQARRMFGGTGFFSGGKMFGLVHDDRLYLKVDDAARAEHEAHGMEPFQPNARQTIRSYYEVPLDVLEEHEALVAWAERAMRIAQA